MRNYKKSFIRAFQKKIKILKDMGIQISGSDYYSMSIGDFNNLDRVVRKIIQNHKYH